MNNIHINLIRVLFAVSMLTLSTAAPAQDNYYDVNSAYPASALQGTLNLDVEIAGNRFDSTIDVVKFLVHCEVEPCNDAGGIIVKNFKVRGSKKIIANIDVSDLASVAGFDIAVQSTSRGRGGKGTTLFSVQAKPNQDLVNCDEFAVNGTCTCMFDKDADLGIFNLLGDCQTAETLVLTNARIVGFAGNSVEEWPTIKAVNCVQSSGVDCDDAYDGDFKGKFHGSSLHSSSGHGSSVITNTDDAAGARFLNIRFDPDVSRGCTSADDIQTAVSFILDENTADNPDRASGLQVWDLTIDTKVYDASGHWLSNDPLCTAIEVVREPGFKAPFPTGNGNKEGQVFVTNVAIADGSYEEIGIRYEGMQPLGSINPPLVNGNVIGAQACGPEADTARAIQFGRVQLSDPSDPTSQVAGVVDSNTIGMATGCGTPGPDGAEIPVDGVGILIVGEPCIVAADNNCTDSYGNPVPGDQTTAEVVKNDVSGAFFGVLVDDNVVDINFSGNKLTGDGDPLSGDIGIDSDAQCTQYKGKPNKISDYNDDKADLGCAR